MNSGMRTALILFLCIFALTSEAQTFRLYDRVSGKVFYTATDPLKLRQYAWKEFGVTLEDAEMIAGLCVDTVQDKKQILKSEWIVEPIRMKVRAHRFDVLRDGEIDSCVTFRDIVTEWKRYKDATPLFHRISAEEFLDVWLPK